MAGGDGDDIYKVDTEFDLTDEDVGMGHDTVQTALSWTLGDNIEDLVLLGTSVAAGTGNASDNTLTGNSAANDLKGLDGADTLIGGLGADTLNGGDGNNSMVGGLGNDTYTLSSADDVIAEDVSAGIDHVKTGLTFVLGDNFENLTLTGTGDVDGTGNDLRNLVTGNSGSNELGGLDGIDTLIGNGGDDIIDGGAGADSMVGGSGADIYYVDDAGDVIVETSPVQLDTVVSSVTYTLSAYVENLDLVSGAIDGTGNANANAITGTTLSNVLMGLGGKDEPGRTWRCRYSGRRRWQRHDGRRQRQRRLYRQRASGRGHRRRSNGYRPCGKPGELYLGQHDRKPDPDRGQPHQRNRKCPGKRDRRQRQQQPDHRSCRR